jgi:hypothetical protein
MMRGWTALMLGTILTACGPQSAPEPSASATSASPKETGYNAKVLHSRRVS